MADSNEIFIAVVTLTGNKDVLISSFCDNICIGYFQRVTVEFVNDSSLHNLQSELILASPFTIFINETNIKIQNFNFQMTISKCF